MWKCAPFSFNGRPGWEMESLSLEVGHGKNTSAFYSGDIVVRVAVGISPSGMWVDIDSRRHRGGGVLTFWVISYLPVLILKNMFHSDGKTKKIYICGDSHASFLKCDHLNAHRVHRNYIVHPAGGDRRRTRVSATSTPSRGTGTFSGNDQSWIRISAAPAAAVRGSLATGAAAIIAN